MHIPKVILFLILASHISIVHSSQNSGFDEICNIYTEAQNSNMPKEQLSEYIFDNVKKRVNLPEALEAHGSVFHLTPSKRYSIFKKAAEITLKQTWDCPAIKALMK